MVLRSISKALSTALPRPFTTASGTMAIASFGISNVQLKVCGSALSLKVFHIALRPLMRLLP